MTPEQKARQAIDRLLTAAGWAVQDFKHADIHASRGVALREFVLDAGQGFADYLLCVEGKACGVVEAKKQGTTLTGVEIQSARYAQGLPATLPAWRRPLPIYESTGVETHFTNGLDPTPRARNVFAFHTPAHLAELLSVPAATTDLQSVQEPRGVYLHPTFLARLQHMPELVTELGEHKLWPAQITAITSRGSAGSTITRTSCERAVSGCYPSTSISRWRTTHSFR